MIAGLIKPLIFILVVIAIAFIVITLLPKDMVIGHRTLHEEHCVLLQQEYETQKSLRDLHSKMDILLNIATNVTRDIGR